MAKKSEVLGGKELARVMRQLPKRLQQNALAATARAGGLELRRVAYAHLAVAMASRSPREEDVLIKRRRNRTGDVRAIVDVGPPTRKPQLRWLHDGTRPHTISAVTKFGTRRGRTNVAYGSRDGSILTDRTTIFGVDVDHPGQTSQPWLKTATFASQNRVLTAMGRSMARALPRQVKRLVSTNYRNQQLRRLVR